MADNDKIKAVLAQLDPLDDDQWTADGAPKVESVSALLGEKITRQDIVNAAPDFNREKAEKGVDDEDDTDQEQEQDLSDPELNEGETEGDDGKEEVDLQPEPESEPVSVPTKFNAAEFLAWLNGQDKEDLEDIEASLKEELSRNSTKQDELKEQAAALKTASAYVKLRIKAEYPNTSDADATRAYIEAQTRARAERMGIRQSVLKGLKPSELEGRSPLDAAMARKTTRGVNRPNRPLMK
jgi:hypothetical protein